MSRYVAFIRAVMLGRGGVEREALLDTFRRAGATFPRSHITTGNISFESDEASVADVVAAVEADILRMAGAPKPLFVRSAEEVQAILREAPFADWPGAGGANELCVVFFAGPVELPFKLPYVTEREDTTYLARRERELFIGTHLVSGRPGNPGAWLERRLGTPVTIRNINTLRRVVRHWESSDVST